MSCITKEQKAELVEKYGRGKGDTGSPEAQVAILTAEIAELTEHLKTHKKDNSSRRGLLMKVNKRRHLLDYFRKGNEDGYQKLIKELGIRR